MTTLSTWEIRRHWQKWSDGKLTETGREQATEEGKLLKEKSSKVILDILEENNNQPTESITVVRGLSANEDRVEETVSLMLQELHGWSNVKVERSGVWTSGSLETFLGAWSLWEKGVEHTTLALLTEKISSWLSQDEAVQNWIDGKYNQELLEREVKYGVAQVTPEKLVYSQITKLLQYANFLQRLVEKNHTVFERLQESPEMAIIGIQQFVITPLLNELSCKLIPAWTTQPWFAEGPSFSRFTKPSLTNGAEEVCLWIHFRDHYLELSASDIAEVKMLVMYKMENIGDVSPAYEEFAKKINRSLVQI